MPLASSGSRFTRLSMLLGALTACVTPTTGAMTTAATVTSGATTVQPMFTVRGFSSPEAVRYDPGQDIYFVSNFGVSGGSGDIDDNGFISRMRPDGTIENLRFIAGGTGGVTLHAPRGMTITGDTLWVADADAVRGFNRLTGAPLVSASFAGQDVGFLNDVAADAEGTVYVTDTGRNRIYRIVAGAPVLAASDSALGSPNGITWDAAGRRFLVVPFGGAHDIRAWRPGGAIESAGRSTGARYDGIEVLADGRILVASQADTSLHLFTRGEGRPVIRTAGRPADIAVDTRRHRVAVPYIALNRVDIWEIPQ